MQKTSTTQFEGTDTIMSLGYAICSFHGSDYQISDPRHQYLNLTTGEPVAIMLSSQDGGWIKGAVSRQGLWKTGWLPLSHWRGFLYDWLQIFTDNIGWKVYEHVGSASHMANGSTTLTAAVRSYREFLLSCHVQRFGTVMDDAFEYGMPTFLREDPIWCRWKVQVYHLSSAGWAPAGSRVWPVGSMHFQTFWLRSIDELASVIDDFRKFGGMYEKLSFRVEEWSWD